MIDWLKDLTSWLGKPLLPFQVVPVAKAAGVLRWGKYNRTAEPGFHWKWPFVEEFLVESTAITTARLDPQTLTTADGITIVVQAIVKYEIVNVEKYITQIWDQIDVVRDVTMSAIRREVCIDPYDTSRVEAQEERVLTAVRSEINRFGFKLHKITFTDFAKIRTFRIMSHAAPDQLM